MTKTCVVSVSGGAASAVALERVLQRFNGEVVAVFADTKQEDADLYRFLADVERKLNFTIIRLAEGRDVWQVFFDERMMGSSRFDLCSRILKRELLDAYVSSRFTPDTAIRAFGYTAKELGRLTKIQERILPFQVWCPLQEPPFLDRCQINEYIRDEWDIDPPRLYEMGFRNNNCGGACVKGGHGAWYHLYRKLPAVFLDWENKEQLFREYVGKDVAILKDRRGGVYKPMTIRELRRRFEQEGYAPTDWGDACNCMGN
jgi:hypothetical protein